MNRRALVITGVGVIALLGFLGCGGIASLADAHLVTESVRPAAEMGAGASTALAIGLIIAVQLPRLLQRVRAR